MFLNNFILILSKNKPTRKTYEFVSLYGYYTEYKFDGTNTTFLDCPFSFVYKYL